MINGRAIGIDARMIEMSGIGTYIQHLLGQGIYDYAVGKEEEIRRYDNDVKVILFDAPIYGVKEQLRFPNKEIKNVGIEIMHFPHYNVPITYRSRYVVTVHDLTHIVFPEFLGSKVKYCYAKYLMSQALRRAEHVFTVSRNSKEDIHDFFKIPENMISITYDAVDEDFQMRDKKEIDYLYEKYDIPKDKRLLLYVGNLKPHKNLVTLLKALELMKRDDVVLLLVGKAFKSVNLVKQEKAMGIDKQVVHTGTVSKRELIDIYNLADVFVFPSLYEGFGIPPLEAMACGTPVIAANNSSIPEIVGEAAILFNGSDAKELSEKLNEVLKDEHVRNNLIRKGRIRSEHFNWNQAKNTLGGGTESDGKPIRVLHYIKHLETGGGESLIFNLYQHIDRDKIQFDFAVNTKDEERLDDAIREMGGQIYAIIEKEPKITINKLRQTSAGLEKLLKEKRYNIIHIHCSNGQGLYYAYVARRAGIRNIIVHIHNTSIIGRFERIKTYVHNNFRKKYMYAPTEYMACSLAAAGWLYGDDVINGNHYKILKNAIYVEKFRFSESDRNRIRAEFGFQNKKVICTIGRCVKEKNQIFILRVLEKLLNIDSDYRLILIGQGELEDELKKYANDKGIGNKIAFIKSTDIVEKYLSASDSFLLSSLSEGLGIVAIEAQANGLYTLVSDKVPDDVLISPFCCKVNLADGEEKWAECVRHGLKEENIYRKYAGSYVSAAGYEISSVAKELENYYLSL